MFTSMNRQLDFVNQKKAIVKYCTEKALVMFKYARKVMYDYEWFNIPELMECRGHVYDINTGNIVQAAPRKCFNYLENNWWKDKPLNTRVRIEKKYNGFMACATIHSDQLLVTTTGSFDSEFQKKAYDMLIGHEYIWDDVTSVFEIVWDNDPHIVNEGKERAIYLGCRDKLDGQWYPAVTESNAIITLGEAIEIAKNDRGEGFMIYANDFCSPAKLKTDYYIGKKRLMRMGPAQVEQMYTSGISGLPKLWVDAPRYIKSNWSMVDWQQLDDQSRRKFLESNYG